MCLLTHSSSAAVWRLSNLKHAPVVWGTAVVRRGRSSRMWVLRCVGWIALCQADCQLVTPVARALHWGHCKQGNNSTQLMLVCISILIVVIENTVCVMQNKHLPFTWCGNMFLQCCHSHFKWKLQYFMSYRPELQTFCLFFLFVCLEL